jgi:hypothetical protein
VLLLFTQSLQIPAHHDRLQVQYRNAEVLLVEVFQARLPNTPETRMAVVRDARVPGEDDDRTVVTCFGGFE